MSILCFGDSITYGMSDTEAGGWVRRLERHLRSEHVVGRGKSPNVHNLGVCGETTEYLRSSLLDELRSRINLGERVRVSLAFGANDAAQVNGKAVVSPERYGENLEWAIAVVRECRAEPWLINITPVTRAIDDVQDSEQKLRANRLIRDYNARQKQIAQKTLVPVIDVCSSFLSRELETFFDPDGLHPNARGHELIFNLVSAQLASND